MESKHYKFVVGWFVFFLFIFSVSPSLSLIVILTFADSKSNLIRAIQQKIYWMAFGHGYRVCMCLCIWVYKSLSLSLFLYQSKFQYVVAVVVVVAYTLPTSLSPSIAVSLPLRVCPCLCLCAYVCAMQLNTYRANISLLCISWGCCVFFRALLKMLSYHFFFCKIQFTPFFFAVEKILLHCFGACCLVFLILNDLNWQWKFNRINNCTKTIFCPHIRGVNMHGTKNAQCAMILNVLLPTTTPIPPLR